MPLIATPQSSRGPTSTAIANGGWQDANPIPAGFGAWGAFEEVQTRNELVIHDLLERAAHAPQNDLDRMLGDYFAAGMDTEAIEAAGISAVQPLLDAIAAAATHQDVLGLLPAPARHGDRAAVHVGRHRRP